MKMGLIVTILTMTLSVAVSAKININTANVDEFVLLKGLGESKAKAIVNYRNEHGKFKNITDLAQVKGIGVKTVEKLSEDLTVSEPTNLNNLKNVNKTTSKSNGKKKVKKGSVTKDQVPVSKSKEKS